LKSDVSHSFNKNDVTYREWYIGMLYRSYKQLVSYLLCDILKPLKTFSKRYFFSSPGNDAGWGSFADQYVLNALVVEREMQC